MEALGVVAAPLVIIAITLVCACCYRNCYQTKDPPQPTVSQTNSNSVNSPSVPDPTSPIFNSRYIATTDIQTGLPVVVDIASIVTQLSQARNLPPYMENQSISHSTSSANYGAINYHPSNYPSAPPPSYSEVYSQPKVPKP